MDPLAAALPPITSNKSKKTKKSFASSSGRSYNFQSNTRLPKIPPSQQGKTLIVDENGNDVTPRPLMNQMSLTKIMGTAETVGLQSGTSFAAFKLQQDTTSDHESAIFGISSTGQTSQSKDQRSTSSRQSFAGNRSDSFASDYSTEDDGNTEAVNKGSAWHKEVKKPQPTAKHYLEPEDFSCILSETDTICLFDLPSVTAGLEFAEREAMKTRNDRYLQVKKLHVIGDNYSDTGSQTSILVYKAREAQTEPQKRVNAESQYNQDDVQPNSPSKSTYLFQGNLDTRLNNLKQSLMSKISPTSSKSFSLASSSQVPNSSMTSSVSASSNTDGVGLQVVTTPESLETVDSDSLIRNMIQLETKVLGRNNLHKVLLFHDIAEPPSDFVTDQTQKAPLNTSLSSLLMLWIFRNENTKGRRVNAITWNNKEHDIAAVAYGRQSAEISSGLVVIWSTKSPECPVLEITTQYDAVSVDFSTSKHTILAVGFADGTISLFNIANKTSDPIWTSATKQNQHHDLVTSLKWCSIETASTEDEHEILMSLSADGRVLEWNLQKMMESSEIICLKRDSNSMAGATSQGIVSKLKSGYALSILSNAENVDNNHELRYLVGTDEGSLHLCSREHTDQFLKSIPAHMGPVYKIEMSKDGRRLLTCGADWAVRLWSLELNNSQELNTGMNAVNDLSWSNLEPNVFGLVTEDGRIEIWDLDKSSLTPLIQQAVLDHSLSQISFAPSSACILAGDDSGSVTVYKLKRQDNKHS